MYSPRGRLVLALCLLATVVAADTTDKVLGARCKPAKAGRWGLWCMKKSKCTGPKEQQDNRCVEGETTPTPEIVCCTQSGPAPPEEVTKIVVTTALDESDCTPLSSATTPLSTGKSWGFRVRPKKISTKRPCSTPMTTAATPAPIPATMQAAIPATMQAAITPPTAEQALEIAERMCSEYSGYTNVRRQLDVLLPDPEFVIDKECTILGEQLISGGEAADPGEFPHMVALGYNLPGSVDSDIAYRCGGSLISPRFVLTAAHCLFERRTGPVRWALLGSTVLNDTKAQLIKVNKSYKPKSYSQLSKYDDIALLQLEHEPLLSPKVRPACVGIKRVPNVPLGKFGTEYDVSGWGLNHKDASEGTPILMKVDLYQVAMEKCDEIFTFMVGGRALKKGLQRDSMLCIGNKNVSKDSCQGDSGGPAQTRLNTTTMYCMYDVTGVTSFGTNICGGRVLTASIYTNVRHYLPWIVSIVWPEGIA